MSLISVKNLHWRYLLISITQPTLRRRPMVSRVLRSLSSPMTISAFRYMRLDASKRAIFYFFFADVGGANDADIGCNKLFFASFWKTYAFDCIFRHLEHMFCATNDHFILSYPENQGLPILRHCYHPKERSCLSFSLCIRSQLRVLRALNFTLLLWSRSDIFTKSRFNVSSVMQSFVLTARKRVT